MGCIYEEQMTGNCTLSVNNEGDFDPEHKQQGCDECGVCIVSDDPDPSYSCDSYESDYACPECGEDLNVNDCGCEEE